MALPRPVYMRKRSPLNIQWKLTMPGARLPEAKRPGDIGFDVYAAEKTTIKAGCTALIKTGLQLAEMSCKNSEGQNVFLKVEGRSGMALQGVFPVGGIIDPTYRGEIGIVLTNTSNKLYEIAQGDRIAQLVVYVVAVSPGVSMQETQTVEETVRSSGGFGSSGK
jgi:dUTP pyrophosphatase